MTILKVLFLIVYILRKKVNNEFVITAIQNIQLSIKSLNS